MYINTYQYNPNRFGEFCEKLNNMGPKDRIVDQDGNLAIVYQSEDLKPVDKKTLKVLLRCFKEQVDSGSLGKCEKTLQNLVNHYKKKQGEEVAVEKLEKGINAVIFACQSKEALNSKDGNIQYMIGKYYLDGIKVKENKTKAFQLFQAAAQNGNEDALLKLALMYLKGDGVDEDPSKAFECYLQLKKGGSIDAFFYIGNAYLFGEGVEKDITKALEYLHKAAEQGDPRALYSLGNLFFSGNVVEIDKEKGIHYWELAAQQAHPGSLFNLAVLYLDGDEVEQNIERAVDIFEKLASQGSAKAMHALGYYYFKNSDLNKGIDYLNKAAEAKCAEAQCELGHRYAFGLGVQVNPNEALRLMSLAALQNYPRALFYLGRFYELGVCVEADLLRALHFYERAAALNDPDAQLGAGNLYRSSSSKKNQKRALKLFKKAADQGNLEAQIRRFECYLHGIGTQQNHQKAIECLGFYSEQGNPFAMRELGYFYILGLEVGRLQKDFAKASSLLKKAKELGIEQASEMLDELNVLMKASF